MKLYTAEDMRAIDDHAIQTVGVEAAALMETAGRATSAAAERMLGQVCGKRVLVLVGKGNNGGDGLVAARVLHDRGASVLLSLVPDLEPGDGPASSNLQAARHLRIPEWRFPQTGRKSLLPRNWGPPDLCIDALLGVGSYGPPRGAVAEMVEAANRLSCPVLAVDIPTGVNASTGQVDGPCIQADVTITFGCGKLGLYSDPGKQRAGRVEIADIGFPRCSVESVDTRMELLDDSLVESWLPDRPDDSNKGTFGTAVVVAGSEGMLGAAALCSRAVLRAGAGLVKLAVPRSVLTTANTFTLEVICKPVPEGPPGMYGPESVEEILSLAEGARAFAIGPGLSTSEAAEEMLEELLPKLKIPMVIDADALNILSKRLHILNQLQAPAILTPHPGEMARLEHTDVARVQAQRMPVVHIMAQEQEVIVVLKGAATLVAAPSGELWVNSGGNAGMATAGTGDVLTGTITGLLAQGMEPERAAAAGVFLHAKAGDLCAAGRGNAGLLAGDLIDGLPRAQAMIRGIL